MATIRSNLGVLRMETDTIEVTSFSPRPDPGWRFTDSHGHEHQWVEHAHGRYIAGGWHWVLDDPEGGDFYFDEDGEEYNAPGHYVCDVCGDLVEPGMRGPSGMREFIPGMTSYWLDDEPISKEKAEAFIAEERDRQRCPEVAPESAARCDLRRGHKGKHHVTEQKSW